MLAVEAKARTEKTVEIWMIIMLLQKTTGGGLAVSVIYMHRVNKSSL